MNSGPIKWHGGKCYLAPWIISLMPKCTHYVEPYFGGGSVLLARDPEGVSEVVADTNEELMNFWSVLACEVQFPRFLRIVQATPFSEKLWMESGLILNGKDCEDDCYRASYFFIHCRQSLAGRMKSFTGITKTRVRRGMNNEVSAWLTAIEGLPAVHERLNRVLILNRDALEVIRSQDGPETLLYLDPPYLKQTRAAPDVYANEMSDETHHTLLCIIRQCKGTVLISGYRSAMYDDLLKDWKRFDKETPNHAAGGKEKRTMTECVWSNRS